MAKRPARTSAEHWIRVQRLGSAKETPHGLLPVLTVAKVVGVDWRTARAACHDAGRTPPSTRVGWGVVLQVWGESRTLAWLRAHGASDKVHGRACRAWIETLRRAGVTVPP